MGKTETAASHRPHHLSNKDGVNGTGQVLQDIVAIRGNKKTKMFSKDFADELKTVLVACILHRPSL